MMLQADDIQVHLGTKHVLKSVHIRVDTGERVALVGPNGCGKSTLLRALCGIVDTPAGAVRINGQPMLAMKRKARARCIGMLSQHDVVPAMTTVQAHVAMGRHPHRHWLQGDAQSEFEIVHQAMEMCAITHLATRPVDQLSGGERQRVRLATLLAQNPAIVLLDEPLTGLDLEHQFALLNLIKLLTNEGRTVITVLHDLSAAAMHFDRVLVMHEGALVADGRPDDVITRSLLHDVFAINADLDYLEHKGQALLVVDQPKSSKTCNIAASFPPITSCATAREI